MVNFHIANWGRFSWQVAFVVILAAQGVACGQPCPVPEIGQVDSLATGPNADQFGACISASGDWAIVGAPDNDDLEPNAGAAYIMHHVDGAWSITQSLFAPAGTPTPAGDRFGTTVTMAGSYAIVGSPFEQVGAFANAGAAHVFVLDKGQWTYLQRLVAPDAQSNDQFGSSVSTNGQALAIGAPFEDQAFLNAGAAYVFRLTAGSWQFEQKLTQTDEPLQDRLGTCVAISGDALALGAPYRNINDGAVYMYRFNGTTWIEQQRLLPGIAQRRFGEVLALVGDALVVGVPMEFAPKGFVAPFAFDGSSWVVEPTLYGDEESGDFGWSLAMDADSLVVGVRLQSIIYVPPDGGCTQGGAYRYERKGGEWIASQQFLRRFVPASHWNNPCEFMHGDLLGTAVSIAGDQVLATAPMTNTMEPGEWGKVFVFDPAHEDCEAIGYSTACLPDCNANEIKDSCDIADGVSADCNNNAVPDECDAGFAYQVTQSANGICYGAILEPKDFLWMMRYAVVPGGQNITHISIMWTPFVAPGLPATALLYSDPNQDGSPSDARLLATASASAVLAANSFPLPYSTYRVTTTYVGEIGQNFFVGMHMDLPADTAPALAMGGNINPPRRWIVSGPPSSINLTNPLASGTVTAQSGSWALAASALDCDGNGTWDQCDIDADPLLDLNDNSILDTCDLPCSGDIAGGDGKPTFRDGTVNIDDLLVVIGHWDQTGDPGTVPGDIFPPGVGDGDVNIDDLLEIIGTWGSCP